MQGGRTTQKSKGDNGMKENTEVIDRLRALLNFLETGKMETTTDLKFALEQQRNDAGYSTRYPMRGVSTAVSGGVGSNSNIRWR